MTSISPIKMEGTIQKYWSCVTLNDQAGLGQIISPNISVESEVTMNGNKQPVQKYTGSAQLLAEINQIASVLSQVKSSSFVYHQPTSQPGSMTMEVDYEQQLVINQEGKGVEMLSKGKQIWTYDGTFLIAVKVFETDTTASAAPLLGRCTLV